MHKPIIALIAALLSLVPVGASAQELSPDQVRLAYADLGYVVDAPTRWTNGVTMLAIHNPTGEQPGWPALRAFIATDGPVGGSEQLLGGYSNPTWHDNVAVMRYDPTAFAPETDCRSAAAELRS